MTHAIIAIGRNEGTRLRNCLTSLKTQADRIIYVDSGSTDDSVEFATSLGVTVVQLDMSTPFTAARARNAGFAALDGDLPEFVQFIDGDCVLIDGWVAAGLAEMAGDPTLGIVTGWRSEIHPDASIYNAMCQHEWRRPAGPITACGGDMLVRTAAFQQAGGFNPSVIAAEDDEFCLRVGMAGFALKRIAQEMTLHDADMHHFSQWWQRSVRNGHGFAQLGTLHPNHLSKERTRVLVFGLLLPSLSALLLAIKPLFLVGIAVLYLGSYLRTVQGLISGGMSRRYALQQSFFLSLSKFPNLIGMATYHLRRSRGADMNIIEYK